MEIYFFSSVKGGGVSQALPIKSVIYHLCAFFLFAIFLLTTIKGKKKIQIYHLLLTLTISFFYAILDETHQIFVPGRNASISDIIINNTGILFALIISLINQIKR